MCEGLLFYGGWSGRCSSGRGRSLAWGDSGCGRVGSPRRRVMDVLDESFTPTVKCLF